MTFLAANLAVLALAWRASSWLSPSSGPWMRSLTGFLVATLFILGATGLALVLGQLNAPFLLVLAFVGLAATWFGARRSPLPAPTTGSALLGVLGGAVAGIWFLQPGWTGTGFCFDDATYHAAVPLHWWLEGGLSYASLTYQAYYPFNAELLGLWALVLEGSFAHSGMAVLLVGGLLVAAAGALLEEIDADPVVGVLLLSAWMLSPKMLYFAGTYSATDLTLTAFFLSALAFSVGDVRRPNALWAGLALGAALGTKVSVAPGIVIVGLWWMWRARKQPALPAMVVAASLLFGVGWYVHNLVQTGNPLFPAELGPFDGPLDKAAQRRTSLVHFMQTEGHTVAWWRTLLYERLDWPFWLGVLSIGGYAVGGWASRRPERRGLALVAVVGLVFLVIHPLQPYSGSVNRPNGTLHHMVRYLTLVTGLGLVLLAANTRDAPAWRSRGLAAGAVLAVGLGVSWTGELGLAAGTGAVVGGLLAFLGIRGGGAVVVAALLLVAVQRGPEKTRWTAEEARTYAPAARHHAAGFAYLDQLEDRTRVAYIADMPSTHSLALPMHGSRLQHELVAVDRHGRAIGPLHTRWSSWSKGWWTPFRVRPKRGVPVVEALLEADVEVVVLARCQHSRGGAWPKPRETLRKTAPEHRLYGDACVEVWAVDAFAGRTLQEGSLGRK